MHPYAEFDGTDLWKVLDEALTALVENSDIEERTARAYIVGYLANRLISSGLARKSGDRELNPAEG